MTEDEKTQIKKDKLWEIHLCEREIACLESKAKDSIEAMQTILNVWNNGSLGSDNGHLLRRIKDSPSDRLRSPDHDFAKTIESLEQARKRLMDSQKSFDRM